MPHPSTVNPSKFTISKVLYDHNDFAIGYGIWHPGNGNTVVMRWNDASDGNGYPKTFGHPQWFVISNDIAKNLLTGLLNNTKLTSNEYHDILEVLKTY